MIAHINVMKVFYRRWFRQEENLSILLLWLIYPGGYNADMSMTIITFHADIA